MVKKINKSESSWECKRVLETIPITTEINCYRLTEYVNGKETSVLEGFTRDSKIGVDENVKDEGSIKMQRVLRLKGFTSVGGEFVSNLSHLNLD